MNRESVDYLAAVEADVSNMPVDDAKNHFLFHVLKQLTRIADALEKQDREKRGY